MVRIQALFRSDLDSNEMAQIINQLDGKIIEADLKGYEAPNVRYTLEFPDVYKAGTFLESMNPYVLGR